MIIFPDSESLFKKVFWLCKLRWFAVGGILLSTTLAMLLLKLQINYLWLYIIAGLLFLSNLTHILFLRSFLLKRDEKTIIRINNNINIQILTDFVFLTILLHFSGGIENPFVVFYIFHMIISSILLPKKWTFIHTTLGVFLFLSLAITEFAGILPHYSINKYISLLIQNDRPYLFSALLIFTVTSYLVVFITSTLSGKLRSVEQKLKDSYDDLLKKDQIKNEYVQCLTHDIKGHIAAIKSNIEVVYKQFVAPLDSKNMEYVEKAYNRTQMMNDFIYDLLVLTNMRLNDKFEREQIDIIEILNNIVNLNKSYANSKNITLSLDFNILNLFYSGIKSSIEEVISNILQNAIKYTPEGGEVHLQAFSDDNNFVFFVSDNGYGISEHDLSYIFDEFYRGSNIKTTIKDGTGLGLSLVKTIVERHFGTITVESTLGKGSKFTVNLPHGYK